VLHWVTAVSLFSWFLLKEFKVSHYSGCSSNFSILAARIFCHFSGNQGKSNPETEWL
jgi:hypothetical protein